MQVTTFLCGSPIIEGHCIHALWATQFSIDMNLNFDTDLNVQVTKLSSSVVTKVRIEPRSVGFGQPDVRCRRVREMLTAG